MQALWTVGRILVALAALGATFVTLLIRQTPGGTTIETSGAVVDLVAVVVLVAVLWSLWRDRARLF